MNKPRAWIGIDLGTSGCRVVATTQAGDMIAVVNIPLISPTDTAQSAAEHWQVVYQCLQVLIPQCGKYQIAAIAVAATSGSVLLVDANGKPQSPILMYHHAAPEHAKIIAQYAPKNSGAQGAYSGLAKVLTLFAKKNAAAFKLLHQADWINANLGAPLGVSDENNALKTGYDIVNRCWPDWLSPLINKVMLPKVVPMGTPIGHLSADLCHEFSLATPPALIAGTTDSIAALIATGAAEVGDAVTALGSTLVLKLISDRPVFLPEQGVYSHRFGQHWLVGGASNSGGGVLAQYFTSDDITALSAEIDVNTIPPNYYPLPKKGERFPHNDPDKSPQLNPRPVSDSLFLHGLLDGIARIEMLGYQVLKDAGGPNVKRVFTTGGGAANTVWQNIRQQYMLVDVAVSPHTEAAYGASILAREAYMAIMHTKKMHLE